jgi:hypothetical protein
MLFVNKKEIFKKLVYSWLVRELVICVQKV